MKLRTAGTWAIAIIAATLVITIGVLLYRANNGKVALQKLLDTTKPDISSENGLYGYYRIYTGMLICKDCDSIATRLILKSEQDFSTDGVATFETTKIFTGEKPLKQPIQKALWAVMNQGTTKSDGKYISLFGDKNSVAAFQIDQGDLSTNWKIIVEATPEGKPLSSSENRIGKLILMSEGDTTP